MRTRYSFLMSRTWVGWFLICVLFAVACWFLGQWQLDRREMAMENINRVVSNFDQDPVPYAEARELFSAGAAADEWTVIEVQGTYLYEDSLLVRNRGHGGQVGLEQLVPLREQSTGEVLIVSRGWLPTASEGGGQPAFNPEPSRGTVEVILRMRPAEPEIARDAPEGQLASIDLREYASEVDYPIVQGAYGLMAEETPAADQAPYQLARPSQDEGPHLSYSMQWIAFGLLGFVGWGYAARVHARNRDVERFAEDGEVQHVSAGGAQVAHQERMRAAKRARRAETGQYSDEDAEDAWVDKHLTPR